MAKQQQQQQQQHYNNNINNNPFPRKYTDGTFTTRMDISCRSKQNDNDETVYSDDSPNTTDENEIGASIVDLALPALGALLIDPIMTLIDTAFVGRFTPSAEPLAGMGTAAALLSFSFYIFNFFCTATTPLVASQRAAGNEARAKQVGGQALSLALFAGTILTATLLLFQDPLLQIMGAGAGEVVPSTGTSDVVSTSMSTSADYATSFLMVRALAAPAVLCISASTGVLRGYLDTTTPIYILFTANAVNFVLDVILVAGAGMGPQGAAIATTSAEWISALLFLGVLSGRLPSPTNETLSVQPLLSVPSWEDAQPLVVASGSVLLRSLVLQLTLSSATALAARDSSASVAAHQIAIQLWLLCSEICDALAAASQALVADGLGQQNERRVRAVTRTVFQYSLGLGMLLAAGLGVGSDTLVQFFTPETSVQESLAPILTLLVLAQPLNSLVFAADGVLQGASEFPYQARAMAISGVVAWVSCAFLQTTDPPPEGNTLFHVWLALNVLQLMRGITSAVKLVDDDGPIRLLAADTNDRDDAPGGVMT